MSSGGRGSAWRDRNVEHFVRSFVKAALSLLVLQAPSTRAQELDHIAVFLEFCTGTRIAEKIVLTGVSLSPKQNSEIGKRQRS